MERLQIGKSHSYRLRPIVTFGDVAHRIPGKDGPSPPTAPISPISLHTFDSSATSFATSSSQSPARVHSVLSRTASMGFAAGIERVGYHHSASQHTLLLWALWRRLCNLDSGLFTGSARASVLYWLNPPSRSQRLACLYWRR